LIFTNILADSQELKSDFILFLTAEERKRSQQRLSLENGMVIYLKLPRGTILKEGDILATEKGDIFLEIKAKSELVMTVISDNYLDLIKAAYHLGNRHIPLEITANYLRFNSDLVLEKMLIQLGLKVQQEIQPFYPEIGAYHHH
jgi:urease accessory protein